jgi:hypothetical protein
MISQLRTGVKNSSFDKIGYSPKNGVKDSVGALMASLYTNIRAWSQKRARQDREVSSPT